MDLEELVRTRSVIICVGSGGVGKTTMSAAIALKAAQNGRRVCVLTIDPAKRLANAMGLEALGNTATRVDDARFDAAGIARPVGELWAMMLDTKRTWDALVLRFANSPEQADRILQNHYYQQISTALAGSQEFMAMEKLYELHASGQYDLVVLDTPPTRHALDFLDAPKKMLGFMDEGVLKFFLAPTTMAGKLGFGFLQSTGAWMFKALQTITGFDVLGDIAEFVDSFRGMYDGFRERATAVEALLRAGGSTCLLVTSPHPLTVDDAKFFHGKLLEYGMPFGGFVVNRVHADALNEDGATEAWERLAREPARILVQLSIDAAPDLGVRLAANFTRVQALARADAGQIARLEALCPGSPTWRFVPAFDVDVHDLSGLSRVNEHLFSNGEPQV
jgi:anion-transporting  ArsA/GET3 family ATPase